MITLDEARAALRYRIEEPGGATCPLCTQHAQVYRRRITAGSARALIAMYRHDPTGYMHVPTVVGDSSGDPAKLALWSLIEDEVDRRDDGGRSGYWRLTELGRDFALGRVSLPKYVRVYNGRVLDQDWTERADIDAALGSRFHYRDLMYAS